MGAPFGFKWRGQRHGDPAKPPKPRLPAAARKPVYDATDPAQAEALFYADQTEGMLQARLRDLCKSLGLLHYHTHRSVGSEKGFPDSTIARDPAAWGKPWVVFVELKREEGARVSDEQKHWGRVFALVERMSGGAVAYRLIRPSTWRDLEALLTK